MAKQLNKFTSLFVTLIALGLVTYVVFPDLILPRATQVGAIDWSLIDWSGSSLVRDGDYLKVVGRYWTATVTIDYDQALQGYWLTPGDVTMSNEQIIIDGKYKDVSASKSVAILIQPGDPYLTMDFKKEKITVVPTATGYDFDGWQWTGGPNFKQTSTLPLTIDVYRPMQLSSYKIHLPFKITVTRDGQPITIFDSEKVEAYPANAQVWTLTTSYGNVVINDLGNFQRGQTPPAIESFIFLPNASIRADRAPTKDKTGKPYSIYSSGYDLLYPTNPGSYAAYWFAGTSAMQPVYNFLEPGGISSSWYGAGWADIQLRSIMGTGHIYCPIQPQVSAVQSGSETKIGDWLVAATSVYRVTKDGQGLLEWLPSYVSGLGIFSSWELKNADSDTPTFVGYIQPNAIFTKAITLYIDSKMADTWVNSPLVSTFQIVKPSKITDTNGNPVSLDNLIVGRDYKLTVTIKNTGDVDGATANVAVTSTVGTVIPDSFSITGVGKGATKSETVSFRCGNVVGPNTAWTLTVRVYNTKGDKTDEESLSGKWQPAQDQILIKGLNLNPDPVPPRGTSVVTLELYDLGGGSGAMNLRAEFIVTGSFTINPKSGTLTLQAGQSGTVKTTLTSTADIGIGTLIAVVYDANSNSELVRTSRAITTGTSQGNSSSNLVIVTYLFEPTKVDYASIYKLHVKVHNKGLLPENAFVVVEGDGIWLAGTTRNALILPIIDYETEFQSLAPFGGSGKVIIAVYDSAGRIADTKTAPIPFSGNWDIVMIAILGVSVLAIGYFVTSKLGLLKRGKKR
jgi:hypothetical protein